MLGLFLHQLMTMHMITAHGFTFVNSVVLNLFLLPIIIFQSGWSLRRSDFMSQFEYILVFAILGTLISTFFIAYVSWGFGRLGWHAMDDLRSNFVFAALISAVDPVATLSTYAALGVEPLLNIMVFGESTINDAVAIVLFNVINEEWDDLSYLNAAGKMCILLFGSMGFGILVSTLLIFFMRMARMTGHTHGEVLYVWACAFFIFALAESLHFSGIIANLFAGIVFGIYGRGHLTEKGQQTTDSYLKLAAATADNSVFILCGTSTALMSSLRGFEYGMLAVAMCLVARMFSVLPCGLIVNGIKTIQGEPNKLSWTRLVMMWHSGLRGGIALVLALEVNAQWCPHKATIVNGTFVVICVLLFLLGGSTEIMLGWMGIQTHVKEAEDCLVVEDRYYVKLFNGLHYVGKLVMGAPSKKEVQDLEEEEE
jgi:sodium/hydrogen exchanger 8